MLFGFAALVALAALTACRRDPPPPAPDAGPATVTIDRRALLVGVDRYRDPGITALRGARNDVEALRGLLIERHGFAPEAIHTLLGPEATGDAIVAAFRARLIDGAGPGTIAVFHFSGHGRRVWDTSGDEPDGWDEAIVPYDAGSGLDDAGLIDDVFAPLVDALVARGAAVTLIFDSCYSGSPVRGGAAVRSAPPVGGVRGADAAAGAGDVLEGRPGATVIAAAQSTEKAHEVEDAAGQHHGALTWALVRTLRAAPADATWRAVMAEVRHRVGLVFAQQTPALGGERPDRVVFERAERPPPPRSFAVEAVAGGVRIAAGSLHGVTAGSVFALVGPDGAARGRVVVARVGAASAEAVAEAAMPPAGEAAAAAPLAPGGRRRPDTAPLRRPP
ncbi:MAG: caspase family protein [Myxococcales bacterium]|nr:caspase family protein [Myxococcales bacterium]